MDNNQKPPTFKDLYPDLSAEEQGEASKTLRQYLELVKRIYNRLKIEGKLDEVMEQLHKEQENNKRNKVS